MCDFYMLCRLCVHWCSLRWTEWLYLECLSVAAFLLVCVCLLCRKLCSYRVLQWLFAQRVPFGWTTLLRCCLLCVVRHCRVLWFVPVLCECVGYVFCYVRKKALLLCLRNYREEGYGPVWGTLAYVFVGFWDRYYVSQLPYVRWYVGVKCSFQHFARNESSRGPMCFRCLVFNLSGPCELLFSLCFIASWTWVVVLCVVCLSVFVNGWVKQFTICLGVLFCWWMLWKCLVWVEVLCCLWSQCASSIVFVYVFECRKLPPILKIWKLDLKCLLSSVWCL